MTAGGRATSEDASEEHQLERRRRLLFLGPHLAPTLRTAIEQMGFEVAATPADPPGAWHDDLASADVIFADWTGRRRLGEAEAIAATRAAFVQQLAVGLDTIDLQAWADRKVPVANAAGANASSVAEWCVASAFITLRSIAWADNEMRHGGWPLDAVIARGCHELASRRVGIVGLGAVGTECARRFRALGCDVSYWNRHRRDAEREAGATYLGLDDLCERSEIIVVAVALTVDTHRLIDAERLAVMPTGSIVINAARGEVLDESALLDAIRSSHLGGAALDVFSTEPLDPVSPLRSEDRILLSPHSASSTIEAVERIGQVAMANLRHALAGEPLDHVQNATSPLPSWKD